MTKFFMLVLATVAPILRGTFQDSQEPVTLEMVRQIVRKEVLGICSRFLVGFVISSAIVLSLAQLGGSIQRWLSRFENALTFEILGSSGIALVGSFALYLLFRDFWIKPKQNMHQPQSAQTPISTQNDPIDIQGLALRFVEGFADAVEARKTTQKASYVPTPVSEPLGPLDGP